MGQQVVEAQAMIQKAGFWPETVMKMPMTGQTQILPVLTEAGINPAVHQAEATLIPTVPTEVAQPEASPVPE